MKTLLLFIFLSITLNTYADGPIINGNLTVMPGSTETYSVTWDNWDGTYEYYANVQWDVIGGTVISSDKHSATIEWNNLAGYSDFVGSVSVSEDLGGQNNSIEVTIVNMAESTVELCTGFLGPAKVSVDFGTGTNPGAMLPPGTTTYQYNSGCGLAMGEYTIRSSAIACRTGWHNVNSDHTGNANGYFFMANASSDRSEIYRTTVSGFTTSFSYEFSAWVGNLLTLSGGELPIIRFEIYDLSDNLISTSG